MRFDSLRHSLRRSRSRADHPFPAHCLIRPSGRSPIFDIRRLANRLALHAPADERCGMLSFPKILTWRTWRWRTVTSTLQSRRQTLTMRELLGSLKAYRNRTAAQSPHLVDLISLLKGDVESSERFPLRRGGPDTPRSLGAWKSRYRHLDRYRPPRNLRWTAVRMSPVPRRCQQPNMRAGLWERPNPHRTDGERLIWQIAQVRLQRR